MANDGVSKNFDRKEITLSYFTEFKVYLFSFYNDSDHFGMVTYGNEITNATATLNKYLVWNARAIKKQVTLDKLIAAPKILFSWTSARKVIYPSPNPVETKFHFFSQNERRHQLVLSFPRMVNQENVFDVKKPDTLYLDKDQVELFISYLSEKHVKKVISEWEKQKKIEEDFQ